MAEPKRGEIWVVDWSPGRGSEQLGRRPALIVQTDAANQNPRYPNTIVVTLSTKGRAVTTHVRIEPNEENGLKKASFAKCEQILTISKARLQRKWGRIRMEDLERVDEALSAALEIE